MSEYHGSPEDPRFTNQPIPPHLRQDNVVGNSPLAPKPPAPPKKKRHVLRNIAIVVGSLFALLIVAAVLSPGTPAKDAGTATPPSVVGTPDMGPSPEPVITPTNKPSVAKPTQPTKTAPKMTASQEQAIGAAESYLDFTHFSRKGLIHQLSSDAGDGFSVADATYAVDHIKVDWNEQAAAAARSYLEMTHFSRQGLIHQLESSAGDGFTHKQAVYGVSKAGL